ncbi:hypothetical protein Bca52824_091788 [Brassica carinata]|uniref:Uncharacterized protein n=1 Tax=Brassica carinata TaxID=52824 RepID=A0A8X7NW02_BRACI|nr:hypothetical protein Bca52824_091788 [Brassica carinata]
MVAGVYVDTQGEWSSPKSRGDRDQKALEIKGRVDQCRSGGKKKVTQQASVRCLESGLRYLLSAMVM